MANEITLEAASRTEFGKGAARRIRRADQVPAVIYGHGQEPVHITLPHHETQLALRQANALLSIVIDGGEPQLALPKEVQRHPFKSLIEHVDLVPVRKGEKVTVEVPLQVTGADKDDRIVVMDLQSVTIEAEATHIPSEVAIDLSGKEIGDSVHAADLVLPEGANYAGDPEDLILTLSAAPTADQLAAELDAAVSGTGDEADASAEGADEAEAASEG
ncbi:MAG: 50S ribosomal protein L25/general stress protein Ctc [Propioniciclava sp.]